MDIRIILNGKKAGNESVRAAIYELRKNSRVEVRSTWESGDVLRLVQEACNDGCTRLVAGGGDGTVKETVDALMSIPNSERPELAILPLGTANDFATGCNISAEPLHALSLATTAKAVAVDCVRANEHHFINIASGGFGAQVTSTTPVALKNFLGGGAYTLAGLAQALSFVPYSGQLRVPGESLQGDAIAGAICNGRQAGGGQILAPDALINNGLLEIVGLMHFPAEDLGVVIKELMEPNANGRYVKRYQVPWAEWQSDAVMPINLDGEPIKAKKVRFEVVPAAIKLVVPAACPLITSLL
jgi:lipid kinase YegS